MIARAAGRQTMPFLRGFRSGQMKRQSGDCLDVGLSVLITEEIEMEYDIADMIREGLRRDYKRDSPDICADQLTAMCFGALSAIVERLVSDDEPTRKRAKATVARLIEVAQS